MNYYNELGFSNDLLDNIISFYNTVIQFVISMFNTLSAKTI